MINVEYDHQIFCFQTAGGISRYFVELATYLRDNPELGIRPIFNFKLTSNVYLVDRFPEHNFKLVKSKIGLFAIKIVALIPRKPSRKTQILHFTYYSPRLSYIFPGIKTVSTLHDMIPEIVRAKSWRPNPHMSKIEYLSKSDSVIAVSRSSADAYSRIVKNSRKDVSVVPLGVSKRFSIAPGGAPLSFRYFLYLGPRNGYKDAITLLRAFSEVQDQEVKLVFVGGGSFSAAEQQQISEYKLTDRVIQMPATDDLLSRLYTGALGFVMTSRLEGFGLPIIEAAIAGCPLVLSDIPTSKEIIGDDAIFFEPGNATELAASLNFVLENQLQTHLKADSAKITAQGYSWENCAIKTSRIYRRLLEENNQIRD